MVGAASSAGASTGASSAGASTGASGAVSDVSAVVPGSAPGAVSESGSPRGVNACTSALIMELPISTIEFFKSVGASAGAASTSVAASAAGSTTAVGAVSVVSGTGSATFMSSGEATEDPSVPLDVAQPMILGRRTSGSVSIALIASEENPRSQKTKTKMRMTSKKEERGRRRVTEASCPHGSCLVVHPRPLDGSSGRVGRDAFGDSRRGPAGRGPRRLRVQSRVWCRGLVFALLDRESVLSDSAVSSVSMAMY